MKQPLSPSKAIKQRCRYCMGMKAFRGCKSELCFLNKTELLPLKRIKAHCISCVPEQNIAGVKTCAGEVLDPYQDGWVYVICSLHPFRMGHNPNLKGKRGKGNPEALRRWREHQESQAKLGAGFDNFR